MKSAPPRSRAVGIFSALALLFAVWPSLAQESSKSFSQTMIDWAKDQFQDTARAQGINQVFGNAIGEPVNQAIDLGQGLNTLINTHGVAAVQQGMDGNYAATQTYLNQQVPNDLLNIVLPQSLSDIIPNAQKLYDQAAQWGNNLINGVNQIGDKFSGAVKNLASYFSGSANGGLQSGSPEAQAALAGNLGTPQNIASTLDSGQYQPAAEAPAASTQAQNTSNEDPDEEDIDAPAAPVAQAIVTPTTSPIEYPTVTPISMASTDPNSCIKTSNSMGVGSVSIDCSLPDANKPAEEKPSTDEDDALMAQANQRMDNQEAGLNVAQAQSQNMANSAAMQQLAASQAGTGVAGKVGGACSNPNAGSGVLRCQNIAAAGVCDHARKMQACVSAAIPSCGGCAACVAQAQSLIASARATAAAVCN